MKYHISRPAHSRVFSIAERRNGTEIANIDPDSSPLSPPFELSYVSDRTVDVPDQ